MIKSLVFSILMLFSVTISAVTFQVKNDGEVGGYFMGASAGNASYLSIIVNDVVRFEGINNHTTPINGYTNFGTYNAGDNVEFVMYGLSVHENTWYSDVSRNSDGWNHMNHTNVTWDGTQGMYVSWEDLPKGASDADFNDGNFIVTNVVPSVPEPETYAMLLIGLGLVGFTAYRRGGGGGFVKNSTIPGI